MHFVLKSYTHIYCKSGRKATFQYLAFYYEKALIRTSKGSKRVIEKNVLKRKLYPIARERQMKKNKSLFLIGLTI